METDNHIVRQYEEEISALRREAENYRILVENQTDLIVKVDTQGRWKSSDTESTRQGADRRPLPFAKPTVTRSNWWSWI